MIDFAFSQNSNLQNNGRLRVLKSREDHIKVGRFTKLFSKLVKETLYLEIFGRVKFKQLLVTIDFHPFSNYIATLESQI